MTKEQDRDRVRGNADRLQAENLEKGGEFTDWFEELYEKADGDSSMVPWGDQEPRQGLVDWMSKQPQGGEAKALDVGCGLGDNAAFLDANGYDVTAIDLSHSAIEWAAKRFADGAVKFCQADLFDLPDDLIGQFDLVHETYTLQALPDAVRPKLFRAIADLVAPDGRLLVITRSRDESVVPDGPPWPLAKSQLDAFLVLGLTEIEVTQTIEANPDGRQIPHLRIEYQKTC
ncbi:MAG: class I SAM-dependent methyltransferase [bacterium]|nr:class I SAM-dependent methyltransferase [bacterium]